MYAHSTLAAARKLIAIESVADKPEKLRAALDVIIAILEPIDGVTIEHFENDGKPSLLAYYGKQRPERFKVLLNGHVDVVHGLSQQFKPTATTLTLHGRGALDMKTAAVVMTEVFCSLAGSMDQPVGLQIVTDEEIGGKNGTDFQIKNGVLSDFMIAGEATPLASICTESRGMCWATVRLKGKRSHSAYPWLGSNAVLKANALIDKLMDRYPTPSDSQWATTVNIASVETLNQAFNQVPDEAIIKIDIRYVPNDPFFSNEQKSRRYLEQLDTDAEVNFVLYEPGHRAEQNDPMVRQLAAAIEKTSGIPARYIKKHGAADLRFYSAIGTPAVGFGLQGKGPHGDTEQLDIASIEPYRATLRHFLLNLS